MVYRTPADASATTPIPTCGAFRKRSRTGTVDTMVRCPRIFLAETSGGQRDPRTRICRSAGLCLLALVLLLLGAAANWCLARGLLVYDKLSVALFAVPLEASKVWLFELVIGLLLELLVDGITGVFDGDAHLVAGRDFQSERPFQVDLPDGWGGEELAEGFLVLDGGGRLVQLPIELLRLRRELDVNILLFEIVDVEDAFDDTAASAMLGGLRI